MIIKQLSSPQTLKMEHVFLKEKLPESSMNVFFYGSSVYCQDGKAKESEPQ